MLSTFTWGRRLKGWRCSGEVRVQQEIARSWGRRRFTGRTRLGSNVTQSGAEEVGGKRCWCRLSGHTCLCEALEKSNERLAWFRLNQLPPNKNTVQRPWSSVKLSVNSYGWAEACIHRVLLLRLSQAIHCALVIHLYKGRDLPWAPPSAGNH